MKVGIDADGKPKGVKMMTSKYKAHHCHIQREALERAGEDLFISTLSDHFISSLQRPTSIPHPLLSSEMTSPIPPLSSPARPTSACSETSLINPSLHTHTNQELTENTMPPLIDISNEDELYPF